MYETLVINLGLVCQKTKKEFGLKISLVLYFAL